MWYALDLIIEEEAREAVGYALMEAGALGTETVDEQEQQQRPGASPPELPVLVRATGYFDSPPGRESVRESLREALRIYALPSSAVRDMSLREVEARDWLGEWKKNWRAVEVGRFVVAPPWSEVREEAGRIVVRVEPGMAFGTGTHETTRLCLAAIGKHFRGASFLDVGTGTGVLAIAAAKLHPASRGEACDTDAEAVEIARENARLNGVADQIEFRVGSVGATTRSADFVCANLTADVIVPLLPSLLAAMCGRLVLSGILAEQSDWVLSALRALGVTACEIESAGEWIAITV